MACERLLQFLPICICKNDKKKTTGLDKSFLQSRPIIITVYSPPSLYDCYWKDKEKIRKDKVAHIFCRADSRLLSAWVTKILISHL